MGWGSLLALTLSVAPAATQPARQCPAFTLRSIDPDQLNAEQLDDVAKRISSEGQGAPISISTTADEHALQLILYRVNDEWRLAVEGIESADDYDVPLGVPVQIPSDKLLPELATWVALELSDICGGREISTIEPKSRTPPLSAYACFETIIVHNADPKLADIDLKLMISRDVPGKILQLVSRTDQRFDADVPVLELLPTAARVSWFDAEDAEHVRSIDRDSLDFTVLGAICEPDAPSEPRDEVAADDPSPQPPPPVLPPKASKARSSTILGGSLVGVGAVVGLGLTIPGAALGLSANQRAPMTQTETGRLDAIGRGRLGNNLLIVGAITGGALLVTGITMLVVAKRRTKANASGSRSRTPKPLSWIGSVE